MTFPQPSGGPAPDPAEPRERPELPSPVAIATELWLVVIAAMTVAQFGAYSLVRDLNDKRLAELPKDVGERTRQLVEYMANPAMIVISLVIGVVVGIAIALVAMYYLRQGHNWARILLAALSSWMIVGGLFAFGGERHWTQAPEIIAAACAAAALLLLMRRDSDTYCREMAEFRAAAKTPVLPTAWPQGSWTQPYPGQPYAGQPYPGQPYPPSPQAPAAQQPAAPPAPPSAQPAPPVEGSGSDRE